MTTTGDVMRIMTTKVRTMIIDARITAATGSHT